jgi:hypothetical protein
MQDLGIAGRIRRNTKAVVLAQMISDQRIGPNLAKGNFLAKFSSSEAKTGEKSICHTDRGAPYGVLSGRKMRIMHRQRSFEYTGGAKPDERAAETGQNAWSNRQNELVVRVPA